MGQSHNVINGRLHRLTLEDSARKEDCTSHVSSYADLESWGIFLCCSKWEQLNCYMGSTYWWYQFSSPSTTVLLFLPTRFLLQMSEFPCWIVSLDSSIICLIKPLCLNRFMCWLKRQPLWLFSVVAGEGIQKIWLHNIVDNMDRGDTCLLLNAFFFFFRCPFSVQCKFCFLFCIPFAFSSSFFPFKSWRPQWSILLYQAVAGTWDMITGRNRLTLFSAFGSGSRLGATGIH